MNILPYSERDPRWAERRLGASNELTIGTAGCLLTCVCMAAQAAGVDVWPNELNAMLRCSDGFEGDAKMRWYVAARVLGLRLEVLEECLWSPAPAARIREHLDAGWPAIIRVDSWKGLPDEDAMHWVLWVNDRQYIDPFDGTTRWMREPARNILAWAVYRK